MERRLCLRFCFRNSMYEQVQCQSCWMLPNLMEWVSLAILKASLHGTLTMMREIFSAF
ncbi:hypothetical protein GIB67_028917, partial [Kingdonia uniflora]